MNRQPKSLIFGENFVPATCPQEIVSNRNSEKVKETEWTFIVENCIWTYCFVINVMMVSFLVSSFNEILE